MSATVLFLTAAAAALISEFDSSEALVEATGVVGSLLSVGACPLAMGGPDERGVTKEAVEALLTPDSVRERLTERSWLLDPSPAPPLKKATTFTDNSIIG